MNKNTYKIGLLLSIITLLGVAYYSYKTFKEFDKDTTWVSHSERVKTSIETLSGLPQEISNEIRQSAITGATLDRRLLNVLETSMEAEYEHLDSLTLDNTEQAVNLENLIALIRQYSLHGDSIVSYMSNDYKLTDSLRVLIAEEETMLSEILEQADEMKDLENALLEARTDQSEESGTLAPITLLILTFIAIGLITWLFIIAFNLADRNARGKKALEVKIEELDQQIIERSQLEQLLRKVLDSSSNGIMSFTSVRNEQGHIVDFEFSLINEKASEIVDAREDQILGAKLLEKFTDEQDEHLFESYKKVVETGSPFHMVKQYVEGSTSYWYDIVALKSADGLVVTFSDITEQKNYEEELLLKQRELEATNYELEQFAYIASHDLQEPLRKVRTFGDRLRATLGENLNEKGSDYLTRMQNAAERMQTLIDDLLKFSRLSRADRVFKKVDLNETLAIVTDNLDMEIANKKAIIKSDDLPTVEGDYVQFQQLFQNMITNALKYSKADVPPEITVKAESIKETMPGLKTKSRCWKISFTDNGIGFDPQYKEQIFVIFKRLHGRTEYSGSGIGLAICDKIIKNHGGVIRADSELGKGSTFSIVLPKS